MVTFLIVLLTIISLELKLAPKEVYILAKSNESLLQSSGLIDSHNVADFQDQLDVFNSTVLDTKPKLKAYLMQDFPRLLFPENNTFDSVLVRNFRQNVIGMVRIHTVHTKKKLHRAPEGFSTFSYEAMIDSDTINTTDLGKLMWQRYRTAEEVNETYVLEGEFSRVTGDGYTADFDPKNTTAKEFVKQIELMREMLFGESVRAMVISYTAYSKRIDWWTSNIVLYEFGTSS